MGYLHIANLYKEQDILLFRECWALEKVHGTSAHILYRRGEPLVFFSGGASHKVFSALFDEKALLERFEALGHTEVVVYGEAYGGSMQGMKATYGDKLQFIVFDVMVSNLWLSVPDMAQVATGLGLEVVPFQRIVCTLENFDELRDRPSEVAERRGMGSSKRREGVVLRPLIDLRKNNGSRIIVKHRLEEFSERATPQKIMDPAQLAVLTEATAIAQEWVTPMRLTHVLDKCPGSDMSHVPQLIAAMVEDIYREAKGEIVESKEAVTAIGRRTAILFRERLQERLKQG